MKGRCAGAGVKFIQSSALGGVFHSDVIKKVRNTLGSNGVRELGRTFCSMDADGNRLIDSQELFNGLTGLGLSLSSEECSKVLAAFDKNGNGTIDFKEFYQGVVGPISKTKMDMIDGVFNKFDKAGTGMVKAVDLKIAFNATYNPSVISGEMTKDEAFLRFLANFSDSSNTSMVTKQQWHDYYAAVALATPQDK